MRRSTCWTHQIQGRPPALVGPLDVAGGRTTWTADGLAILVVGTVGRPVGHARLLRIPIDGGSLTDLAETLDRNVIQADRATPARRRSWPGTIARCSSASATAAAPTLYAVIDGGQPRPVVTGAGRVVAGMSVAGGLAAIVLATPTSFGEVVTVDLASGTQTVRTSHGANLDEVELFTREERQFRISDGTLVHGWVIRDPATSGPQPLLLDIHGGPHNAWNAAADPVHVYHQELAARGWAILLLNPRASDGYGEQFFNAALGGWGRADAKDFLEPIDALVAEGLADPGRLSVAGYSYGGFMTCYLTSRDDRFAAAVAGGLISDLVSMAGTSDAGHHLSDLEIGGLPFADPDAYAAMSPLTQVTQVRTPTLIVHGAADVRCPIGQAEQWHTALRERGVPTRMVLYPDASHLFILDGKPSHRIDFNQRVVDWVGQYAGSAGGPRRARIDAAHWQRRLTALAERHRVPGAALGILRVRPGRG